MVTVDVRSVTRPVGVLRIMAAVLTCMCFSLVATTGHSMSPYWAWAMFTWIFCFLLTLFILVLEFGALCDTMPFSWDDFTAAFARLASLMCLVTSIIYPTFFTCATCHREIGASVLSWTCFAVYTAEAVYTQLQPRGQTSGFLSTLPGIMKMLETFIACLIFTSLEAEQFRTPGLAWCVAVFSLCFAFALLIILLTLGKLTFVHFDKLVILYNILSAVMYTTATVIWPLYSFDHKRPPTCGHLCSWDKLVVVTFMTILNCIVYTLDTVYSIRLVFCAGNQ